MNRQNFLGTLIALPVGLFLVQCSSDGDSGAGGGGPQGAAAGTGSGAGADQPAAPPARTGTQTVYSSSNAGNHFHTFSIDDGTLGASPPTELSGNTSEAFMHTHGVTVSVAQLQQLAAGDTLTVTSSTAGAHAHVFTFLKVG